MDSNKSNSKSNRKRGRPSSQKGSPNKKMTKRVKLSTTPSSSRSNSKTRKTPSVEYDVLPDDPIDFKQWVYIAKNFVEKVHRKIFMQPRFSIVAHQERIQKPLVEIGRIAAELYAKLHGIIALELDVPVQCEDVLHAPKVGTGNLIHGITKRAEEILRKDIEQLTKRQKAINDSYTKALMANRLEVELQGPDSDAAKFPPVPPKVEPILFANINEEIYKKAIKDREPIASEGFYINIVDAAKKYKKELSKIINIYEESNQLFDYERITYSKLEADAQSFYREYLLVSIMLDQDVDVPSVTHEGDANEIRKKTINKLCKFYETLPETPNFDGSVEAKISPPKYARGSLKNAIHYMVDPQKGLVLFKRAEDKEFKISIYPGVMKTHEVLLNKEDPSKKPDNSKNKTAKKQK